LSLSQRRGLIGLEKSLMSKTVSESLFERFCDDNHIEYRRIGASSIPNKKEPDYEIQTATEIVVVEVKQFDPSEEEKKLYQQLQERGYTDAYGGELGVKVRHKIQDGAKQLKARSEGKLPALLVLYNNVPISDRGVDPYEIKTGMYGIEKIDLAVAPDANRVSLIGHGFGPKRKVTPSSNTSLSAVGAFYSRSNGEPLLVVFHNIHAVKPLDWRSLQGPRIRHFTLGAKEPRAFQEWQELKLEANG
jgi:hypothetical protein